MDALVETARWSRCIERPEIEEIWRTAFEPLVEVMGIAGPN